MDNGTVRVKGNADIRYEFAAEPAQVYRGRLTYYLDPAAGQTARLVMIQTE